MRETIQKAAQEQYREGSEDLNTVTVGLVKTELDLAETFCALAANSSLPQKAERSREHALQALGGAARVLSRASVDERERAKMLRRIARVQRILNNSSPISITEDRA